MTRAMKTDEPSEVDSKEGTRLAGRVASTGSVALVIDDRNST